MTVRSPRPDSPAEARRHWREAVARLRPVPAAYRRPALDTAEAAKQLGCERALVEELVAEGLPATATERGPLLDYHDVMNLGLASGLGGSLAEQAERRCMRMATGRVADWLLERTWRIRLGAPCTAPGCAGARPAPPAPELLGGRLLEYTPSDGVPHEATAVVVTRGRLDAPRTAAVREIHDTLLTELTSGAYQFGWLPRALRAAPAEAAGHRMVDCVVAAWLMRRWAEAAGLPARTRKGYLLGLVGVEHAWTEVLEEGRWLALDPVLAFLARRRPPSSPEFTDFCRGSVHNRLLAWPSAAEEPITEHRCAAGGHLAHSCHHIPSTAPTSHAARGAVRTPSG
ncbi:transglutaminase domain-containing protein [Streptomyces sp. URMC 123]|uniref:transglutaminase domain-containing protein n=1 Tax=Streptomyces sp. URMC 123 TaxID=3423403 RepID=UPI003F1C08CE